MTWQETLIAALTALWKAIKPYVAPVVSFLAGMNYQQGQDAKKELADVSKAASAVADFRNATFDERVQFLERRKRVRGVPK
jgi:hypothetical protein